MLFRYRCVQEIFKRAISILGAKSVELSFAKNGVIKLESGGLARFADGSATAKLGETVVLATVVSKESKNSSSFLPLTVDYRQKSTAAGLIPNTWSKRDGGVLDREVLSARLIDRSIRPLFPKDIFTNDTQVVCTTHSIDPLYNPLVVAINAASTALTLSDIPWDGPIGAVQLGLNSTGEVIINPTNKQLQHSLLNLIIAVSHDEKIVMMDANGQQVGMNALKECVMRGIDESKIIIEGIRHLQQMIGKKKRGFNLVQSSCEDSYNEKENVENQKDSIVEDDFVERLKKTCVGKLREIFTDYTHDKISRDTAVKQVRSGIITEFKEHFTNLKFENAKQDENITTPASKVEEKAPSYNIDQIFNDLAKSTFKDLILEGGKRCDGREVNDLRDISCRINTYPLLHGSSLFQRGQTQVTCSTTFGSAQSVVRLDAVSAMILGETNKDFFLHYEFPPYGINEIGRTGVVNRREMGHGALAEKALKSVVPADYPFTILLSAEVLESNGSSSMASVCAGSLALVDAGVPINELVSGVAMGLITDTSLDSNHRKGHVILTDLMGIEDYMGDMDFKIASTRNGVTAFQLDTKLPGLDTGIVFEAMERAIEANKRIIDIMSEVVNKEKVSKKESHPVVEDMKINVAKRAKFLGVGGSNLRKILTQTGVQITAVDDEIFQIFAPNFQAMSEAKEMIQKLLAEQNIPNLDFGAIYKVRIEELKDTGAMVVLHASMPPIFIPNGQLDSRKVGHPSHLDLKEGQEIKVKYFGRDPVSGKIRLSRKVLQVLASDVKNYL